MSDKHFGQKDVQFAVYQQGVWMGSIVAKMWQPQRTSTGSTMGQGQPNKQPACRWRIGSTLDGTPRILATLPENSLTRCDLPTVNLTVSQSVSLARARVVLKDKNVTSRFTHKLKDRRCPMQPNEFQEQVSFRDDEQTASGIPV